MLQRLPARPRRRWLVAATATGAMLLSQGAVRSAVALDELPDDLRDELRGALGSVDDDPVVTVLGAPNVLLAGPAAASGAARGGPPLAPTAVNARADGPTGDALAEVVTPGSVDLGAFPDGTVEVAHAGGVTIVTEGSGVELVGFHEASSLSALPLEPAGDVAPAPTDPSADAGPALVLPTRNRGTALTSAVDLALHPDAPVVAPVSGEVVAVDEYVLYGRIPDALVRVRPDGDPELVVSVVHVVDPSVTVGDRVVAGETVLAAGARQLPFESQIDRFTAAHRGQAAPHVHIELRRG